MLSGQHAELAASWVGSKLGGQAFGSEYGQFVMESVETFSLNLHDIPTGRRQASPCHAARHAAGRPQLRCMACSMCRA